MYIFRYTFSGFCNTKVFQSHVTFHSQFDKHFWNHAESRENTDEGNRHQIDFITFDTR